MAELSFCVLPCKPAGDHNDHEVRIRIDGHDLVRRLEFDAPGYDPEMAMLGIDPAKFFKQAELESGGRLVVARCCCGDEGCGCMQVRVLVEPTEIRWTLWLDDYDTVVARFSRDQYMTALAKARNDHSWESLERTAERLVADLDWSRLSPWGITLCHVYARGSKDSLSVAFWLESQGRYQLVCSLAWNHLRPTAAVDAARCHLLEMEPSNWSGVVYYPQGQQLPRPALAGPGWKQYDPGPR